MTVIQQFEVVMHDESDERISSVVESKSLAGSAVPVPVPGGLDTHRQASHHRLSDESSIGSSEDQDDAGSTVSSSFYATTAEQARDLIEYRFDGSEFGHNVKDLPTFNMSELELGTRLGKGGFSNVDELRGVSLHDHEHIQTYINKVPPFRRQDTEAPDDIQCRNFIADHATRSSGDARYALKRLRSDISDSADRLLLGLCDLAVETRILSSLEHPNVIKLRGISDADPYSIDYFLVLDRLYDTLQTRIETWHGQHRRYKKLLNRVVKDRSGKHRQELLEERLVCAFDLSDGLRYLHENHVIHRDIKPENIGFDVRGDIKIFDFGMAKELRKADFNEQDGLYRNMSSMTGTLRYMAPEVWQSNEYNSSCDVYSYGIMLWEIMALQLPLANIKGGRDEFVKKVVVGGARPHIRNHSSWLASLKDIMEKSWSAKWQDRYTMEEISDILRNELVGLRGGNDSNLDHSRRRSTNVFCSNAISNALEELDLSDFTETSDRRALLLRSDSRSLGRAILESSSKFSAGGSTTSLGNLQTNASTSSLDADEVTLRDNVDSLTRSLSAAPQPSSLRESNSTTKFSSSMGHICEDSEEDMLELSESDEVVTADNQ